MEGSSLVADEGIISKVRSRIYASFFNFKNPVSTAAGFEAIIRNVPNGSRILDVGCGDGLYYKFDKVVNLIKEKGLTIFSIDIDAGAIPICRERIKKSGLSNQVTTEAKDLLELFPEAIDAKYDIVLFMESFPVISRDLMTRLIVKARTLGREVHLYHNLVERKTWFLSWFKPKIKYISLVDFGQLTSKQEQEDIISRDWGISDYTIEPLLECKYGEMHWLLNVPIVRDYRITQYLVSLRYT
jgi:SAM-dependent methyltransferase